MTQFGGDMFGPHVPNTDVRRMKAADEAWTAATDHLDTIIATLRNNEPALRRETGNSDPSVLFDAVKGWIINSERDGGAPPPVTPVHQMTILMCAAAITRLVRAPRTKDILAQLDKELTNDDHDD